MSVLWAVLQVLLWIVGILLALLLLLCLTRVSVHLVYRPDRKWARVKIGVFYKTFWFDRPAKPQKPKKPKEPKPKKQPVEEGEIKVKRAKRSWSFEQILDLAKAGLEAGGQLLRALKIPICDWTVIVGHDDPADAALTFGRLQIIWHSMVPLLWRCHIKPNAMRFALDFDAEKITVEGEIKLRIRIGAVLWIGLKLLLKTKKMSTLQPKEGSDKKEM